MTFFDFIKDKILILVGNLLGMMSLTGFLLAIGNSFDDCLLILAVWIMALALYTGILYRQRKRYFSRITALLEVMDQPYLIAAVMEPSYGLEDRLYREILHHSNKAVIEKINLLEDEQQDYKEYIESWIHEVKAPITAMNLICENNKNSTTRKLLTELEKIENCVEMALFYARSEAVYKDYFICRMDLKQSIAKVISRNKHFFIQNRMSVQLLLDDTFVYSDEKWVVFILNQILLNAVKYKRGNTGTVEISKEESANALVLRIKDYGAGIKENELKRIFDKGFTGSNGRILEEKSTGIGLYLCKKLCGKLNIEITAESKEQEYTTIILIFPISTYFFAS